MVSDPGADILASVRALVDERDTLRARVAELETLTRRQSTVLAHAADLLRDLDAFAEMVSEEPATPEPERATAGAPFPPGTRFVTVSLGNEEPEPESADDDEGTAHPAERYVVPSRGVGVPRFSLADGQRWLAEMRDGATLLSLARLEECATKTVRMWVERAGGKVVRGRLAEDNAPEIASADDDGDDAPPFVDATGAEPAASS